MTMGPSHLSFQFSTVYSSMSSSECLIVQLKQKVVIVIFCQSLKSTLLRDNGLHRGHRPQVRSSNIPRRSLLLSNLINSVVQS